MLLLDFIVCETSVVFPGGGDGWSHKTEWSQGWSDGQTELLGGWSSWAGKLCSCSQFSQPWGSLGWPKKTSKGRAAAAEAKGTIILEERNSTPGRRACVFLRMGDHPESCVCLGYSWVAWVRYLGIQWHCQTGLANRGTGFQQRENEIAGKKKPKPTKKNKKTLTKRCLIGQK